MDMLIKLHGAAFDAATLGPGHATLRKPIGPEQGIVRAWVGHQFGPGWESEAQVALGNRPPTLWVASRAAELLGFACFDATALGFFGPVGVVEGARGQGLGAALTRVCLRAMRDAGYGYAIVGGVGVPAFFERLAGAVEIADSTPGLYRDQCRGIT